MKKKLVWLLLLAMLATSLYSGTALGIVYENAIVDGRTSDRVHLRAEPSIDAISLGLYYSGTTVALISDPDGDWVKVSVGAEIGYMMTKYVRRQAQSGSVKNQQPTGTVRHGANGGKINMRTKPSISSEVATSLRPGDTVTVLGETDSLWYFVRTSEMEGYIRADLLAVDDAGYSRPTGRYGKAIIDAKSSDRVHLRLSASANSASKGLYFTGTVVSCESDPGRTWVKVTIGSESGYIMSEYLARGNAFSEVEPLQPTGVVNVREGARVNLRSTPSTASQTIKTLPGGKTVTILGETHSGWYCVRTGGVIGYIEANFLRDTGRISDRQG